MDIKNFSIPQGLINEMREAMGVDLNERRTAMLKVFLKYPNYENFVAARSEGLDTMTLLKAVPEDMHERLLKTAYRFGLEDIDFRTAKDYGDPSAVPNYQE